MPYLDKYGEGETPLCIGLNYGWVRVGPIG